MPWNPEHYIMKPKIIHTKTFSCDDGHPIAHYTVDKDDRGVCEHCHTKFLYEPKDFHTKMMEEKEILNISMKESKKQKDERTPSEKMQDELEPIPCPMHEDYDEPESRADWDDYVNKILKGSG
jgi:hypothetical protein